MRYQGNLTDSLAHEGGRLYYEDGNVLFEGDWKSGEFNKGKLYSQGELNV